MVEKAFISTHKAGRRGILSIKAAAVGKKQDKQSSALAELRVVDDGDKLHTTAALIRASRPQLYTFTTAGDKDRLPVLITLVLEGLCAAVF